MKKIIIITFLMVSMMARGQGYEPFIDPTKQWNIMSTSFALDGAPATKTTMKFHISNNDTIINDTLYHLVINTGHTNAVFQSIAGFIREEISEKKVYFREADHLFNMPKDRLLYDFSLEVGDTTKIFGLHHCEWYSNIYKIISVGKITLLNNEERKVWYLEQIGDQVRESDIWIEGIGSLNGFMFPGCSQMATISFLLDLLCHFEEGVKLYMSGEGTCEIDWSSDVENYAKGKVKVFPNPASKKVTITLPDEFQPCSTYQILSMGGKKVDEGFFCETSLTIPVKDFQPGIYYLRVFNASTQITLKLIIIK